MERGRGWASVREKAVLLVMEIVRLSQFLQPFFSVAVIRCHKFPSLSPVGRDLLKSRTMTTTTTTRTAEPFAANVFWSDFATHTHAWAGNQMIFLSFFRYFVYSKGVLRSHSIEFINFHSKCLGWRIIMGLGAHRSTAPVRTQFQFPTFILVYCCFVCSLLCCVF